MSTELVKQETQALTAADIRAQVNLIQEVMKEVMQEGQHYGKVPGCGDKPALFKPGAEKLSMTFRLRPVMDNDRDINIEHLPNGHREIRVYCHIMNMAGVELATGVGSCSTMESKYRYRGGEKLATGQPVPTEYWNLKKAGKKDEAQALIGGSGFGVGKADGMWQICEMGEKMENPDIADTYNTVLKMAKKRAYVDGILSSTGASDIFTQDIEDMDIAEKVDAPAGKPKTEAPKAKNETKAEASKANGNLIPAISGKVVNMEPHKYKSGKIKTDYTIITDDEKKYIISEWREPNAAVAPETPIIAVNVKVSEYNGQPQYIAESIRVDEPEIPFGE
ncbi:MAG: hypothetical protein A2293_08010 [Elusimicrobia bacterium RIFOXYB2_FULL_49_7]|nr:MAG: hypothetical protein A2293_08010 [Elusimicrobia bacterium RIFOXYB2_FULL_49_7]